VKDAEQIRANQWRQGCVLLPEQLPSQIATSLPLQPERDQLFYVLTHDCDLVQENFEKEPFVELLLITPVSVVDGNLTHGKNSRMLEFTIGVSCFRASCHDRFQADRRLLAQLKPSEAHPSDPLVCDLICHWMAKRYIRPAFPDTFNIRLNREDRAIKRFLKKHGSDFEQIYIDCDPPSNELSEEVDYKLRIWLVFWELEPQSNAPLLAEKLAVQFEDIITNCPGIEVIECLAIREAQVNLAHLRIMSPWDFDFLTYRELDDC